MEKVAVSQLTKAKRARSQSIHGCRCQPPYEMAVEQSEQHGLFGALVSVLGPWASPAGSKG